MKLDEVAKKKHTTIDPNWILLDTYSTVSVCCNASLVRDIRDCEEDEYLTIVTNGGKQVYKQMGVLKNLPIQVFYKKES